MSLQTCFLCLLTRIYLDWSNNLEISILVCFLRTLECCLDTVFCCSLFWFCCWCLLFFFKQKLSPLSWEFSLFTPSAMCSCTLSGSFLYWAGCGSSEAVLLCARILKGESGDERCMKASNSEIWSSECILEYVVMDQCLLIFLTGGALQCYFVSVLKQWEKFTFSCTDKTALNLCIAIVNSVQQILKYWKYLCSVLQFLLYMSALSIFS